VARAKSPAYPSWTPPPPQVGPIRVGPPRAPSPDYIDPGVNENREYDGADPSLLKQNRRASGNLADDPTGSGAPVVNSNPIAGRR
jgi:hypothetical protein